MTQSGIVLAVDYGLARVGLARSDETGTLTIPLAPLHRTGDRRLASEIVRCARDLGAILIVVGIPLRDDEKSTPVIDGARNLARQLEKKSGLPVRFVDESHSSAESETRALDSGMKKTRMAANRDSLAAAEILRRFLEETEMGGGR